MIPNKQKNSKREQRVRENYQQKSEKVNPPYYTQQGLWDDAPTYSRPEPYEERKARLKQKRVEKIFNTLGDNHGPEDKTDSGIEGKTFRTRRERKRFKKQNQLSQVHGL